MATQQGTLAQAAPQSLSEIPPPRPDKKIRELWYSMKARCYNPSNIAYPKYGGKGIAVCDEWRNSYITFEEWAVSSGWTHGLSVDRIDNEKGYCPENCRLADKFQQARNRRPPRKSTRRYSIRGGVGVGEEKDGKWRAWISVKNTTKTIGRYETKEDAMKARAAAVEAVANGCT